MKIAIDRKVSGKAGGKEEAKRDEAKVWRENWIAEAAVVFNWV